MYWCTSFSLFSLLFSFTLFFSLFYFEKFEFRMGFSLLLLSSERFRTYVQNKQRGDVMRSLIRSLRCLLRCSSLFLNQNIVILFLQFHQEHSVFHVCLCLLFCYNKLKTGANRWNFICVLVELGNLFVLLWIQLKSMLDV